MNNSTENTEIKITEQIKDTDVGQANHKKLNLPAVICLAAVLSGGILAVLRSLVLFGGYDNRTALYPFGALNTALWICTVGFGVALAALAYVLLKKEGGYRIYSDSVGMIFSQSLVSFSFAALAFSIILLSKKAQASLDMLDSVLIALSLVAAVAFFSDAFAKKDVLGVDASVVLKLFASVCCLFVTFYFYFDGTTAIHNTNKKFATLAFVAGLLAILYTAKSYIKTTNKLLFVSVNALCVAYCMAYALPNLIWYFSVGTHLLLNVFFDVVALALGIWSGMTLISFVPSSEESVQEKTEETEETEISSAESEEH